MRFPTKVQLINRKTGEQVLQHQDGNQGCPHLRLHGVRAGPHKRLALQVLFDRLEEQFHLPRWTGTGARRLLSWRAPAPGPSLSVQPSPRYRRAGIHIFTFQARSSFTRVTACQVAHPPCVGFTARLRPDRFPGSDAGKLPSPAGKCLGGSFPHW